MVDPDRLTYLIRETLFRMWDPIGINDNEKLRDEYDAYIPAIFQMLKHGDDEYRIAEHLSQLRVNAMGLSLDGLDHDRIVAQRLIQSLQFAKPGIEPPSTMRELMQLYSSGDRDFSGCEIDDSPDNDIQSQCLDGAIFDNACLSGLFVGTSFRGCSFRGANIKGSDFSNADLRGADLRGALIDGSTFKGARTDGALFEGSSSHSYKLSKGEIPDW